MTTTREGQPDEITVSPEYVARCLSWIDGLDAHEGPVSTQNVEDLIAMAREFAKGYGEHAAILKHVIADRERVMGERNDANARAYERQLHIVFTGFPGPGNECVFVEVETPDGKSVNAGEWRKRADGLVELVIAQQASCTSLRDHFAGQALIATYLNGFAGPSARDRARLAYAAADAMLAERHATKNTADRNGD